MIRRGASQGAPQNFFLRKLLPFQKVVYLSPIKQTNNNTMMKSIALLESLPLGTRRNVIDTTCRAFEVLRADHKVDELGSLLFALRKEADIWSKQFMESTRAIGKGLWDLTDAIGEDMIHEDNPYDYCRRFRRELYVLEQLTHKQIRTQAEL